MSNQPQARRSLSTPLLLLCFAGLLIGGCNTVGTSQLSPTSTPPSLVVPPVPGAGRVPVPAGDSKLPTATVAPMVTYPPVDAPSTGDQRATAQAVENAHATAEVVRQALPYPIQTNEATVVPSTSLLADAWGPVAVASVPLDLDGDYAFVLHGVDPEARFLLGVIVPRVLESQEPARLVTVDVGDGRITEIASYLGPYPGELALDGSHIYASDTDGEWIVWNEPSSVRAYNLTSGETRLLDESPEALPQGSFNIPQVDRGVAIWNERLRNPVPYSSARIVPAPVRWANLSNGEGAILSESGAYPAISWPVAAWLEYPAGHVNDSSLDLVGRVMLRNLETGEQWDLPNLPGLAGVALDGDSLFFTSVFGQGFLTNLRGENPRLVAPDYSSPYQRISMTARLVTWDNGLSSAVYDRVLDRLVYLGQRQFAYPVIRVTNGQALAWEEVTDPVELEGKVAGYVVPSDYKVYVVNTSGLPK